MVKSLARPEKESFTTVAFFHGDGLSLQERYTDSDQEYLGFASEPRMKVELPDNEGTFDKRQARVILPLDNFTGRASSGVPHSPIYAVISEVTQGLFAGDQNSQRTLFKGRCMRTIKNFQGQANKVAFFFLPLKSRLDISLGLPCNHHCAWTLFKGGCGANQLSFQQTTEIDSVDGQEVTIVDNLVTQQGASDPRYWKRGWMQKGGLRIAIRDYDHDTDPEKFYMSRRVPTDWIGGANDILIVPGCDKTIETCRDRFNQEETFLGLGYAIPAYQPIFESPS